MSEANDNIIGQPRADPRREEVTGDRRRGDNAYESEDWQAMLRPRRKIWLNVLLAVAIPILSVGLLISAVQKVREAAARMCHINNCKSMCLAINSIAGNTTTGSIPPSYGPFPPGGANQSFFVSLLPFIDENDLYANWVRKSNTPVKTYIDPADPYNPGTNSLISYGSNANLLTVGGSPTLPGSFGGRTSGTIVVFERTAKSGATWSSSNSYLIDKNGSSSPEFTSAASWSNYGSKATALTSAGCIVGMGDGSARIVTQGNANAGWAWAMDPSITDGQPVGW